MVIKSKRIPVYSVLSIENQHFIACDDVVKIGVIETLEDAQEVCEALNKNALEEYSGLRADPCHV